jgi:hypothetical protein
LGYRLEVAADHNLADCERLVFWDVSSLGPLGASGRIKWFLKAALGRSASRRLYEEAIAGGMCERMALILAEPPSVCARNFDESLHRNFKTVFTWNSSLVDGKKYIRALLPVAGSYPEVREVGFQERKLLVDISANKYSRHEGELYTERRTAIGYFTEKYPDAFDLYGTGWDRRWPPCSLAGLARVAIGGKYVSSWRGTVKHKREVLPKYRFALCYENGVYEDYVSNRIFDTLRCKCVPIYLGAPNITDYVDRGAFVDRRDFASYADLAEYICGVGEKEYDNILDAGQAYLRSDRFQRFVSIRWVDLIVHTLGLG